jgi:hypothetical protein
MPEHASDLAARRHIAAVQRRNAYASAHPNVKITHHAGTRRYWEATRTDANKAVWRIREQDLEAFVNRLEDGDWKIAQLPEPEPNPHEQGEWWDAAREWEAPWGVGRRPRW